MDKIFLHDEIGQYAGYQVGVDEYERKGYRARKIQFAETDIELPSEAYYVPNPQAPYGERRVEKRPVLKPKVSKKSIDADGVDEVVFTELPDPVNILIDGVAHTVVGGTLEFSALIKGTYVIEVDQWPYMPWRTSIRAR